MQCSHCQYEFCWECLTEYKSYRHTLPQWQCGTRKLIRAIIIIGILALVDAKLATKSKFIQALNVLVIMGYGLYGFAIIIFGPWILLNYRYFHFFNCYEYP